MDFVANNRGRNKLVVPGADRAIERLKAEVAAELGIADYDQVDKGALPARVHGMIGGSMTKRLIELGQQSLMNGQATQSNLDYQSYAEDMKQDLSNSTSNIH